VFDRDFLWIGQSKIWLLQSVLITLNKIQSAPILYITEKPMRLSWRY
jgi:hypothetical protein